MADESPAHDARTVRDLADACETSAPHLEAQTATAALGPGRRAAAAELRALADASAGAAPAGGPDSESLLAKARDMLGGLVGRDPGSAPTGGGLDALEAQEGRLQARFEAALADDRLSGPVRDAVLRAYDQVKPAHDAVRQAALAARG